jgi:type I restriction enzyme S subunit
MENKLPDNWVECRFGDVAKIHNGYAFATKDFRRNNGVPLIKQSQLNGDKVDLTKCVYLDKGFLETKKDFVLKKGDVLIGMSGSVGKMCLYDLDFPALQNQRTGKAVPSSETLLNKKLFWYFLSTIERILLEKGKGLGVANVSANDIEDLVFALPPLAEQHRIVSRLDAVMQKVESNKQRLEKIPKLLKRFRQSVLAAGVSGKLTDDWREGNKDAKNIFDGIERIVEQRKLNYENLIDEMSLLGKSKPRKPQNIIPTVSISDDFPASWGIMTLSDISSIKQYSMSSGPFGSSLGTKDYRATGVPVVRGQNIQGGVFIAKNFVFISEEKAIELTRSSAIPNDIVIVAVGVGVGNAAIIPNEIERIILSQNCNKFSLDFKIVAPKFILYNLQVSSIKEQMDEATTDTAREFLSLTNLKKLLLPIPPLEEQDEIVRRVEQLFAFADKIEVRYTKAKTMLDKLPQSILAKAFRGELVPQNKDDEPARVLLEKIQAEKVRMQQVSTRSRKVMDYAMEDESLPMAAEGGVKYRKLKPKKK